MANGMKTISGEELVELCALLDEAGWVINQLERQWGRYRVAGIVPERTEAEMVASERRSVRAWKRPRKRNNCSQLRLL